MDLLIASTNKGKILEMTEVLGSLPIRIISPLDLEESPEPPEETGSTFAENAEIKARHFHRHTGLASVADDSGIIVEALKDELGIQTRRWGAGAEASDQEWVEFFLDRMKNESNRRASFVCALAYIDSEGTLYTFEGRCDGQITEGLEADYLPGLPISACFKPDGCEYVYSGLNIEQKNRTSHRGKAVWQLHDFLKNRHSPSDG